MLRLLSLLMFVFLTAQLTGCKKDSAPDMWEFSFTYNGITYTNPDYGSPLGGSGQLPYGIEIRKPDILGGIVRFIWSTNCAFVLPTGMNLDYNENTCTFSNAGGAPIDSSRIFMYSSGSQNQTISNCKQKKFLNQEWTECTSTGNFSFVLVNNAGVTKTITGTYKAPGIR